MGIVVGLHFEISNLLTKAQLILNVRAGESPETYAAGGYRSALRRGAGTVCVKLGREMLAL
jgi:hypothetical protein